MSISLFVYSPDPPLDRALLISACMNGTVSNDVHWELAFQRESGDFKLDTAGPISDHFVYGWQPDHKDAAEARRAFDSGDRAAIDDLYARNAIAAVVLSVVTRGSRQWDDDTYDELIELLPPHFQDRVRNSRTWYTLESGAKRNQLSPKFLEELWYVIGVLANGLMDDPQVGRFTTPDGTTYAVESAPIPKRRPLPG